MKMKKVSYEKVSFETYQKLSNYLGIGSTPSNNKSNYIVAKIVDVSEENNNAAKKSCVNEETEKKTEKIPLINSLIKRDKNPTNKQPEDILKDINIFAQPTPSRGKIWEKSSIANRIKSTTKEMTFSQGYESFIKPSTSKKKPEKEANILTIGHPPLDLNKFEYGNPKITNNML